MLNDGLLLREQVFAYVDTTAQANGGVITRSQLENYWVNGVQLKLIAPMQGINNPKLLEATISVVSSPTGPYSDGSPSDGMWHYAYEGTTPGRTNIKLRRAHELGLPIVYLEKISDGVYVPYTRVAVVRDRPNDLYFDMALTEIKDMGEAAHDSVVERAYRESIVKQRMHQPRFRAQVLFAYKERCAICGLPEPLLLDAAHIRGDKDPDGQPIVPNGLALCSIHHRAYDRKLLGIDGDLRLHLRPDITQIQDGPVLQSALQDLPGTWLEFAPRGKNAPDPYRLEKSYKEFVDSLPA